VIETASKSPSPARHLALGTLAFAVSFAVWGLISAFAPRFRDLFSLSGSQTALLAAAGWLLLAAVVLNGIGAVRVIRHARASSRTAGDQKLVDDL
jgi:nitrate/nitrite transporter NarK